MKNLLLFLSSLFIAMSAAQAQGKISFPETAWSFGVVPQGQQVVHEFAVENTGATALTISKVVAQCGCTASAPSKDVLQPGEKGTVKVLFDTSNFSGDKEKTVTVFSTDPEQQMVVLTIRGQIQPGIRLTPERVEFGEVLKGSAAPQTLAAEVVANSGLQILSAKSFSKHLLIEEAEGNSSRRVYKVSLGPEVPLDEFRARIGLSVQGTDGKTRSIDVPVFAIVKGPLKLSPAALSLGVLEGKGPITRAVKLEYRGPGTAKIRSVESSDSHVRATWKELQKGKVFALNVEADPSGIQRDLRAALTVTVRTSDDREESASLNVYGILPPR